ncbi:MAG: type II/IV secretion system protein [Rhodocyclaceae bacterium]|nr:type II/IV secretion system protein [Rhodocyclaceae bacterium]MBX3667293.1 type II/IV secretion system protein [Rhodocyclaceae bacterium]
MNAPAALPFSTEQIAAARAGRARHWLAALADIEPDAELRLARLAAAARMQPVGRDALRELKPDFDCVSLSDAITRHVLVAWAGEARVAVVADPFDADLAAWLDVHLRVAAERWLADPDELAACLHKHEEGQRALASLVGEAVGGLAGAAAEEISFERISQDASPVVRLVNSTLYDALRQGASDIHLESVPGGMHIKYRLDGVLVRMGAVQGADMAEQVVSRVKVLSELDIAERRVPQDGRFRVKAGGRDIDLRVSVMPSIHGEDAVLRVLDKEHLTREMAGLTLETLGFDALSQSALRRLAAEPHGMLLVTGPTGSGKTTTLYATLLEINNGEDKIITIEDPVEYQLPGVLQIPVNEKKGLTFARGLRSILRHDPDKIMVGEIRDADTAEIAVQAALTGHLVFTTVHANNVFDVIGRFTHMRVDPYSFVAALNGVVAQRLIRLNCPACSVEVEAPAELVAQLSAAAGGAPSCREGQGCGHCRGTGLRGRRAIAEVLNLDDELRELIATRAPVRSLKQAAQARGFVPLRDAGLAAAARGDTSIKELLRVTSLG